MCTVFSIPPSPHLEERAVVEVDARVHRGDAAGDGDVLRPATQMQKLNAHGQHADAILRHDFFSSLFFFAIRLVIVVPVGVSAVMKCGEDAGPKALYAPFCV